MTDNLKRRIYEHKNKVIKGFTSKYNVDQLVFFEIYTNINQAIMYEKRLKSWKREWKENVINKFNPDWEIYLIN